MIPIKATMGLAAIQSLPLSQFTKFQFHRLPAPISRIANSPRSFAISSCSKGKENLTDEILAVELGLQIKKLKSDLVQREEALNKSRELLFTEMCNFMGLTSQDFNKKWTRMNEEERLVLVRGFLAEWSAHYHPLSPTSVNQMLQEYMEAQTSQSLSGKKFFSDFTKLLGFSGNTEEEEE